MGPYGVVPILCTRILGFQHTLSECLALVLLEVNEMNCSYECTMDAHSCDASQCDDLINNLPNFPFLGAT